MKKLFALLLLLLMLPAPAKASPVVADISAYRIAIDASFTGIRLFIFGARNEPGDVVVVIRGPQKDFIVRKKERVAGIWVNRRKLEFDGLPEFYAVASGRPLETLQAEGLLKRLNIGAEHMLAAAPEEPNKRYDEFAQAFLAQRQGKRLYNEENNIGFMGELLFKTVIPFPDTIPRGDYTAEIYLISDGELAGMQTLPIRVEKSGFDAAIYQLATAYPLLYGMLAILLALGAGWVASRVFGRN